MRRAWWHKPVFGLGLILAIAFSGPVYGYYSAGGKLDPSVDRQATTVEVVVQLSFTPESYHRDTLAGLGVYGGRAGGDPRAVRLLAVRQADLDRLVKLYWVDSVAPLETVAGTQSQPTRP